MKPIDYLCPNCVTGRISLFYEVRQVPVHNVLLHRTRDEAINYPKGDVLLGFCKSCGFITNFAFDPNVHEYGSEYESTQAFSTTFNAFHSRLAQDLVARYDLHGKKIIEIGCGQGEFLILLCGIGSNSGIGFDPAYVRNPEAESSNLDISFIADFYSEKYAGLQGDFFCCKMTLEHIQKTKEFVSTVRNSVGDQDEKVIFFQVPNAKYVFGEIAFWDIYYEHCSYFTADSLARLFRDAGFDVIDLWIDYDDQYIMIGAKPDAQRTKKISEQSSNLVGFAEEVAHFEKEVPNKIQAWIDFLHRAKEESHRVVLWGGGSKGVAFLTTLKATPDVIEYVVDINPRKNNTFMAGTGQKVVSPSFLQRYQPKVVVVMNPIYCGEIRSQLDQMDLKPDLITVQDI